MQRLFGSGFREFLTWRPRPPCPGRCCGQNGRARAQRLGDRDGNRCCEVAEGGRRAHPSFCTAAYCDTSANDNQRTTVSGTNAERERCCELRTLLHSHADVATGADVVACGAEQSECERPRRALGSSQTRRLLALNSLLSYLFTAKHTAQSVAKSRGALPECQNLRCASTYAKS
jgi:hypothetical protein